MVIRNFDITVTAMFLGQRYPPVSYQWDLYVNESWVASGTGAKEPAMAAALAVDWAFENGVGTHD